MDDRTLKNVETLLPGVRPWALAHVDAVNSSGLLPKGWTVRIISANRTWAEQDELYSHGRTKLKDSKGNRLSVVTNARGGQSNHNFGIAWDLGVFDEKGRYIPNHPCYAEIAQIGVDMGLDAGARWKSFKDLPHYGVRTGLSLSQMRALVRKGLPIPVPTYGGPHVPDADDSIDIEEDGKPTEIGAFLEGGRVWVQVRPFVEQFGGQVTSATGDNFVINLHDETVSVSGQNRAGVGFAKFADINRVLQWAYEFDGKTLDIKTGGV